jgi:hypothetical protein
MMAECCRPAGSLTGKYTSDANGVIVTTDAFPALLPVAGQVPTEPTCISGRILNPWVGIVTAGRNDHIVPVTDQINYLKGLKPPPPLHPKKVRVPSFPLLVLLKWFHRSR